MQKDNFSFIFNLLVVTPGIYSIKLDGSTIKEFDIVHPGMHALEAPVLIEHGLEHNVSLRVEAKPNRLMAVINNLSIFWPQDVANTRTARISKDRAENEVWDYADPKATNKAQNIAVHRRNSTITLDYMLDNNTPGYINRYCKFVGDDGRVDALTFNRGKLYKLQRSGEFVFTFRTPIGYWLLERFFQEPDQVKPSLLPQNP